MMMMIDAIDDRGSMMDDDGAEVSL